MSEREDRVRLQHMLDASRQAIAFIQGRRREELDRDLQLTLVLTRLVEIVGEAAKNVSDEDESVTPRCPGAPSLERATGSHTRISTSTSTSYGASSQPISLCSSLFLRGRSASPCERVDRSPWTTKPQPGCRPARAARRLRCAQEANPGR